MLIGDVFKRHNLGPVHRGTSSGVAVHQDFVSTACPGPYIMSNLGGIIAAAEAYRTGGGAPAPTPPAWEDTLKAFSSKASRKTPQSLKGNVDKRLQINDKGDTTIVWGPGDVVGLTATVRLKGTPGKRVELSLYREEYSDAKKDFNTHQLGGVRGVFDSLGLIELQVTGSGHIKKKHRIRVSAHPEAEAGPVEVVSYSWNGYARPA